MIQISLSLSCFHILIMFWVFWVASGHFYLSSHGPQSFQSKKKFAILENIINAEKLLSILYMPSIELRTSNNTHQVLQPLKIIIFSDEEIEAKIVFHNLPIIPVVSK